MREAENESQTRTLQHRALRDKRGRDGRSHLRACGRGRNRGGPRRLARRNPVALCASGCRSDGNEPKLQGRCGARACGSSLAGRRGLAELQQNADFRALLRPQPDQHEERRQAQGLMYLRYRAIDGLRDRPDHGERRAHRYDRIRYFLDRPLDLRRELAHARGISGLHTADQSGRGLPRRHVVPWDPGRSRAGL